MRALVLAVLCAGCGARSGLAEPEPPLDAIDAAADVVVVDSAVVRRDSGHDTFDATPRCQPQIDALSAMIVPAVGSCTTVVRIARLTNVITGYRMICGGYGTIDEATAAKTAQADTGVGLGGCFSPKSITSGRPGDEFVFFQGASAAACACCGDGWVSAVSARNGLTVLGGDITFGAGRGLVFPKTFGDPADLGASCDSSLPWPPVRGFDLTEVDGPATMPAELSPPLLQSVLRTVWSTALPDALARKHYLFDAMVLLYAHDVTSKDDDEFVMLLNTGYLE